MLQAGWIIRDLNDPDDRLAMHDFYDRAQDYIILETGLVPSDDTIDELFQNAPPGGDPAECIRLGRSSLRLCCSKKHSTSRNKS